MKKNAVYENELSSSYGLFELTVSKNDVGHCKESFTESDIGGNMKLNITFALDTSANHGHHSRNKNA